VAITHGLHEFELQTTIKHRGVLHLSFYNQKTGTPFGGVYFGTASQVREISPMDLSYYLED
jgi:hypothetical protein